MTRRFIAAMAAAMLLPVCAVAQMRIATVNVQEVFKAMPETAAAEAALQTASGKYQAEYKRLETEFNQKYADFQAISADGDTPATIKERRMQEIQQNDDRIKQFVADAKADLDKRRKSLQAPIYEKIRTAVAAAGSEGGYTYVLDTSVTPVVYQGPDAVDLTANVKRRLGVAAQ